MIFNYIFAAINFSSSNHCIEHLVDEKYDNCKFRWPIISPLIDLRHYLGKVANLTNKKTYLRIGHTSNKAKAHSGSACTKPLSQSVMWSTRIITRLGIAQAEVLYHPGSPPELPWSLLAGLCWAAATGCSANTKLHCNLLCSGPAFAMPLYQATNDAS